MDQTIEKSALQIYFTHRVNQIYIAIFCMGLVASTLTNALIDYWYIPLCIIVASPFIEYFTHQYLLHLPYPKEKAKHPQYAHFLDQIHYLHHQDPKKIEHIFAEWWLSAFGLVLYGFLAFFVTGSWRFTLVLGTWIVLYFLIYEWTHFIAHYDYVPKTRYGKYMKKYHVWHHYKNEDYWYGITSPFADMLFGKFKNPKQIEASPMALKNRGRL